MREKKKTVVRTRPYLCNTTTPGRVFFTSAAPSRTIGSSGPFNIASVDPLTFHISLWAGKGPKTVKCETFHFPNHKNPHHKNLH